MNNEICNLCNTVKIYDEYHRQYKRCIVCNRNHSLKHYYKNKDRILERLKEQRQNNKETTCIKNKRKK